MRRSAKKYGLQCFGCSEFHQNLREKLKKGLHGLDAKRDLEILVVILMCVHAKSARDRLPSIQRLTSRSTGWANRLN